MSLGEYLKMSLKQRISRFGTSVDQSSTAQRAEDIQQKRRQSRHSLLSKKRNLVELTLTPINSPHVSVKKLKELNNASIKNQIGLKIDNRLVMLKQWQANKAKVKAQKQAKSKPMFKVYHISENLNYSDNISKALKEIKGKQLKNQFVHKIAPSSTHKFRPPANVQPISFNVVSNKQDTEAILKPIRNIRKKLKFGDVNKEKNLRSTRNTKNIFADKVTHVEVKIDMPININILQKENRKPNIHNIVSMPSCSQDIDAEVTPPLPKDDNKNLTPSSFTYTSPYVTVSRGKRNARKEYEKKIKGEPSDDGSTPNSAAIHFRQVLNDETNRLKEMCKNWNDYKDQENVAEEVCDMINVAIGQTELLLNKKFKQFHNLIRSCLNGESEKPITLFDLQGFWDTTLLQVKNLDKRFENLDTLKSNNWEEILPVAQPKIKHRAPLKKVKKAVASSGLMATIKDARRKKQQMENKQCDVIICTPSHRRSLRLSSITSGSKCRTCSPAKTIIKTPHPKAIQTPTRLPKSILKSGSKSVDKNGLRKLKTVLFSNLDDEEIIRESNVPIADCTFTPRRSERLLNKVQK